MGNERAENEYVFFVIIWIKKRSSCFSARDVSYYRRSKSKNYESTKYFAKSFGETIARYTRFLLFPRGSPIQHHTADANGSNGHVSSGEGSQREVAEVVEEAIATYLGQGHHTFVHAARFRHTDVTSAKGKRESMLCRDIERNRINRFGSHFRS